MKKIAYEKEDGGVAIIGPAEGERLCKAIQLADGSRTTFDPSIRADRFAGRWPVDGAVVEWAETEAEFVARIAAKDVPQGARFLIVDNVPADRSRRDEWKFCKTKGVKLP